MTRTAVAAIACCLAWSAAAAQRGPDWSEAPEFLRLFAPAGARDAAYSAYVSPLSLDLVLDRLRDDPSLLRPPGAWQPRPTAPLDAFGQTGSYSRWRLVQLYGGMAPRVARGPRGPNATTESWTLISPYPDATLQQLHHGTLLLVVRVAR